MNANTLADKLQIVLITYNRKRLLSETLKQLFADNSPIKDFDITVLDNASTDGTPQLIQQYQQDFPNLHHIVNPINIGGNANICRAFEYGATCGKEYVWVLCDDDSYDFTHWDEVEQAINSGADAILVERKVEFPADEPLPYIVNTMAFVPSTIYKAANITSQVIQNMYCNIYVSYPHLALGCALLNEDKVCSVVPHPILTQNVCMEFMRGTNEAAHHRQKIVNLFSGYINSYQMIADKKLRKKCCDVLWLGKSFYFSMCAFWRSNPEKNYNSSDIWLGISGFRQKLQFICARLWEGKSALPKLLFSIGNSRCKRYKQITILGIKFKFKRSAKKLRQLEQNKR